MKWLAKCSAIALILGAGSFTALGCAVEMDPEEGLELGIEEAEATEAFDDEVEAIGEDGQEIAIGTDTSSATCNQCSNCVLYARCRQPKLPFGLTTYAQKRAIINTQTAKAGYVAIINSGSSYGHVAYVTKVNGSTITIAEGNWPNGKCGTRSGTKAGLKIVGYFKP
ncbi:CHAP domain-containing protein [Chondromyces crocatus]|uniref:Peptidase C51 domain-containing protein n=1 Tax=Chondromyces crocatus TaxID=52 RepID=A0A0K1EIF4_CHOCO|nr:CHAP domain-containing protein [Chondromyces crocatus]AKT40641.1 uncharacterized protein CMC5_047970 [Chondromyces crocatus]